jgi:RNA polymerase sigma-70 factor (ECF subfamily)
MPMEPDRLGQLLDRHGRALGVFARQWCDDGAADDVVQEAFVALAGLETEPERPAAWLFRAVRNAAINAGRAGDRRRRHEAAAADRGWFVVVEGREGAVDPESMRRALEGLPDREREAIVAHLWGGLSFEEAAEVLGGSSSQVHRLYHAGLALLRERLQLPAIPRAGTTTKGRTR